MGDGFLLLCFSTYVLTIIPCSCAPPPHDSHSQIENGTQLFGEDSMSRSLSPTEMDIIEHRMQMRNDRLAQKCHEYGLDERRNDSLHRPNAWEYLVNKKHHVVWCNVFKAASTSWMYNFNILAGYSPEFLRKSNIVPLELARKRYERVNAAQVKY